MYPIFFTHFSVGGPDQSHQVVLLDTWSESKIRRQWCKRARHPGDADIQAPVLLGKVQLPPSGFSHGLLCRLVASHQKPLAHTLQRAALTSAPQHGICASRLELLHPCNVRLRHTAPAGTLAAPGLQCFQGLAGHLRGQRHFSQVTAVTEQSLRVHTQCAVWITIKVLISRAKDSLWSQTDFKSQLQYLHSVKFEVSF